MSQYQNNPYDRADAKQARVGPASTQEQPQLPVTINLLANQLQELHKEVEQLEMRLLAILRPAPPSGNPIGGGEAPTPNSSLNGQLSDSLRGVQYLTHRIGSITSRLEV